MCCRRKNFNVTCNDLKANDMATYGSLVIGAEDAKKILTTKEKTNPCAIITRACITLKSPVRNLRI